MEAATRQLAGPRTRPLPISVPRIDLDFVAAWLLGFGLVVYLGIRGGGFDPLVADKVGVITWWIVLAGLLVGAFPRRRLGVSGWAAAAALTGFLAWSALSQTWTVSTGNTNTEIARVGTYLGVFLLSLFSIRRSRGLRMLVTAVGTGIAVLAVIALLSRFEPGWFPDAAQTGNLLPGVRDRLSYPLNYWNGVAGLIAIGLPLLLNTATTGKSIVLRALSAAALPAMVLAIYMTISRGGIIAGAAALVVYIAFAGDRVPRLVTAGVAGAASLILIGGVSQRDAFHEGLSNVAAQHQGHEMLWMTVAVCLGVGLIQAGLSVFVLNGMRPSWTYPSRRVSTLAALGAVLAAVILAAGVNLPARVSSGLNEFKSGKLATGGASRLTSAAGEQRYRLWGSALDEFSSEPIHGTGSGTFELWWAQHGDYPQIVRDTHSLYLQTLGELGIVGILLLGGFIILVLSSGVRSAIRARPRGRPHLAAALAGVVAFFVSAAVDWVWQLPVLPIAMLILAAALMTTGFQDHQKPSKAEGLLLRAGLGVVALAVIVAVSIPLSSATLLRESQSQASAGELVRAMQSARSAANVEPNASLPRLQQALILERAGEYDAAVAEAAAAAERESQNWKNWLILARVQAEAGEAKAALGAYRRAKSLNPSSPIFDE